ncbi:TPA: hypothetical protein ACQWGN_002088 [Neisseria subflava]
MAINFTVYATSYKPRTTLPMAAMPFSSVSASCAMLMRMHSCACG